LGISIEDWGNFGAVAGAASGALVGLLFVAISLNRDRIARHRALRASALQTLMVFILPLMIALLLLTPHQSSRALGIEIIILGVIHGLGLAIVGRGKREAGGELNSRLARLLDVITPNLLTTVLVLAAGASLVAGHANALYWLVPAVVVAFIGGVANAWLFLIRDPEWWGAHPMTVTPLRENCQNRLEGRLEGPRPEYWGLLYGPWNYQMLVNHAVTLCCRLSALSIHMRASASG